MMKSPYHEGELWVQKRAGVQEMASRIGNSIRSTIPTAAQEFLSSQPMAVLASIDKNQRVWASLVTGGPNFIRAIDDRTVQIDFIPFKGDPLVENIEANAQVGMIAIEFGTRRRMRINGTAEIGENSKLFIHANQVYSNCPKYIQARIWQPSSRNSKQSSKFRQTAQWVDKQKELIERADTFFIASHHKEGGADASHRGGNPGFVRIVDNNTLIFPDYSGNTMFQTLGNITINPNCGLLFIDFEQGSTIQMTGAAEIVWEPERFAQFPGAERAVQFRASEIIEISAAMPLQWEFTSYSPFNPK